MQGKKNGAGSGTQSTLQRNSSQNINGAGGGENKEGKYYNMKEYEAMRTFT
jgi:hypothetical protein